MAETSTPPASLRVSISPPPTRSTKDTLSQSKPSFAAGRVRERGVEQNMRQEVGQEEDRVQKKEPTPTLADIEAGKAHITDHLTHFSTKLSRYIQHENTPRLSIPSFVNLYKRNCNPHGHHFVIHQHDHPIAGPHYDLRLQISETSSVSWAIMYGLPGNPNSRRLNRNATETRVHCLWNHLIETASPETGSLLIWDTGEYSILPFHPPPSSPASTDSSEADPEGRSKEAESNVSHPILHPKDPHPQLSQSEKLHHSFHNHRIRLRLHGARLPTNYTISLRLPSSEDRTAQPSAKRKRRRKPPSAPARRTAVERETPPGSDVAPDSDDVTNSSACNNTSSSGRVAPTVQKHHRPKQHRPLPKNARPQDNHAHDKREEQANSDENKEEEAIRLNNAYPGATNCIGSIHQRRWYLSLDRGPSGFEPRPTPRGGRRWVRKKDTSPCASLLPTRTGEEDDRDEGWAKEEEEEEEPGFIVRGPAVERSVVTARLAREVMRDEGVDAGWVGRAGWRAVAE